MQIFDLIGTITLQGAEKFGSQLTQLGSSMSKMGSSITKVGSDITDAITKPIVGLIEFGFEYDSTMQNLNASFATMLGSQDKAIKLTKELTEQSLKTPFRTVELAEYAKTLLNYGYTNEQVIPELTRLGDVSLGNATKYGILSTTMGKINAMGKLQGGTLNSLIKQGWNPLEQITKKTGETTEEVRSRMRKGAVTAKEVEQALIDATSAGGRFYKGMETGSKTFSGLMSTLIDRIEIFAGLLSKPIFDKVMQLMPKVNEIVGKLTHSMENLSPGMRTVILVVLALVAAIGPLIMVLGGFLSMIGFAITGIGGLVTAFTAIFSPIGLVVIAITGMIVAFGALLLTSSDVRKGIADAFSNIVNKIKEAAIFISKHINDIKDAFKGLLSAIETGDWTKFVDAMKKMFPSKEDQSTIVDLILKFEKFKKSCIEVRDSLIKFGQSFGDLFKAIGKLGDAIDAIGGSNEKVNKTHKKHKESLSELIDVFTSVVKGVTKFVNALVDLQKWGTSASKAMDKFPGQVADAIKTLPGKVLKIITDAWDGVKKKTDQSWNSITKNLTDTWNTIKKKANDTYNGIIKFISDKWTELKTKTKKAWDDIVNGVVGAFMWLYNHNYYFHDLVNFIHNKFVWLKTKAIETWDAIKKYIVDKWTELKTKASELWESIKKVVTDTWDGIKTKANESWNNIKKVVNDAWESIKKTIMDFINPIVKSVTDTWDKAKKATSDTIDGIKKTVSKLWDDIVNSIFGKADSAKKAGSHVATNAKDGITGIFDDAYKWGANVISELIKGIESKGKALAKAASNAAATIAKFLGFHSPAEEGPGHDADKWMPNLINMMSHDIELGVNKIKNATAKLSAVLNPAAGLKINTNQSMTTNIPNKFNTSGTNINLTMYNNIDKNVDSNKLFNDFMRKLKQSGLVITHA